MDHKHKTGDQAVDQFIETLTQCQDAPDGIQAAIDNHLDKNPDTLNWSHVGDAQRLLNDLKAIREYVKCQD